MVSRAFKLRFRRRLRLRRRQVEAFGQQAEDQLERNFFRRLERLRDVRRFVVGWLLLMVLLIGCMVVQLRALGGYYQTLQPAPGGTYTEGIIGAFTNANPVYATSAFDQAASRLVFSGLYKYNEKNQLVGDLAQGPLEVDVTGTVYTVHLRQGVKWHDGKPLTADDILFTYQVIQNPDAQSPLNSSWQGIKVDAPDARTIRFKLPNVLASFPYSLTNGIIPKHILGKAPMATMRSLPFNTRNPIGTGPFRWKALEVLGDSAQTRQEQIALSPFDEYYGGQPKLNGIVLHSFRNKQDMVNSFDRHEINAMAGLDSVPAALRRDDSIRTYNLPLTAAVMTFFRTTDGVLSDVKVRQALVQAADTDAITKSLDYPATPVTQPFLHNQFAYDPAYTQAPYNVAAADAQLDAAGWTVGKGGYRYKDGKQLTFQLYAEDTSEYRHVAEMLRKQWKAAGVNVQIVLQKSTDLQSTLATHGYDALLYGISIGSDPDVYAYWDSAQADMRAQNRLNFSEYNSRIADVALEAGRTRLDPVLRIIKYRPFLQAWHDDAPALGLYQPRYLYVSRGPVFGLEEHYMNSAVDRYGNVQNWMIRQVPTSQADIE